MDRLRLIKMVTLKLANPAFSDSSDTTSPNETDAVAARQRTMQRVRRERETEEFVKASERLVVAMEHRAEKAKVKKETKVFSELEMKEMCYALTGRAGKTKYDCYKKLVDIDAWSTLLEEKREAEADK